MPYLPPGFVLPSKVAANAIPTGFVRETALDGRHPKGAAGGADPGTTGGATTHSHTSPGHTHSIGLHSHAGGALAGGTQLPGWTAGTAITIAAQNHFHTAGTSGSTTASLASVAATFGASSNEPPYHETIWLRSLGTVQGVPNGGWALWGEAALPSGWTAPTTPQGRYLKGAPTAGNSGGQGGASGSHSHAGVAHTHTFGAHQHASSTTGVPNATSQIDGVGPNGAAKATSTHTHTATYGAAPSTAASGSATSGSTGNATPEVPYIKLGLIENATGGYDLPIGIIGLWTGLLSSIPLSLTVCDGLHGTPDIRNRYVKLAATSAGEFTGIGDTGGSTTHDHTDPTSHTHSAAHTHQITTNSSSGTTSSYSIQNVGVTNLHTHSGTSGSSGGTSGAGTQTVDTANHEPPHTTVVWVQFTGAIDVNVTAPAEGETVEVPTFTVEWDLVGSAGTQSTRRVRIYESDASTMLHDSGIVASSTEAYAIPSGIGLRSGRTYYVQVSVVDSDGLPGDSPLVAFVTDWTPPTVLSGLTVTPVGDIDSATGPLPGLHVEWDAYGGDDPFVSYLLERRAVRTLIDGHEALTVQREDDGRILLATAGVLDGVRGAVALRLDFDWDNASEPGGGTGTPTFLNYQADSSNLIRALYDEATDALQVTRITPDGASTVSMGQAITAEAHTLVAAWDADTLYVSFDGGPFATASSVDGAEIDTDSADLGSRQGFDDAGAAVLWAITFGLVPSSDQLTVIHALGDDAPYIDALREVVNARPLGMWVGGADAGVKAVTEAWVPVANVTDQSTTQYNDYRPESGRAYDYAVRVTANVFGEPITSDRQAPPVAAEVTWRGIALHNVTDPYAFLLLHGRELHVEPGQDREYVQARGRRERTAQYGERRDHRISVSPIPHMLDEHDEWRRLERFLAQQQDAAAIYLLRPGQRPEAWYVQMDEGARRDELVLGQTDLVFQQVYYDESAG